MPPLPLFTLFFSLHFSNFTVFSSFSKWKHQHHWDLNPYGLDSMVFCFIIPILSDFLRLLFYFAIWTRKSAKFKPKEIKTDIYEPINPFTILYYPYVLRCSLMSYLLKSYIVGIQKTTQNYQKYLFCPY